MARHARYNKAARVSAQAGQRSGSQRDDGAFDAIDFAEAFSQVSSSTRSLLEDLLVGDYQRITPAALDELQSLWGYYDSIDTALERAQSEVEERSRSQRRPLSFFDRSRFNLN